MDPVSLVSNMSAAALAILSIQSHVVYGYAGNSAAVFPMQRLGHEVWAVNTVEFSNHTGYGSWKGKVLGAQLGKELIEGLEERGVLNRCGAVLSGYLGDRETGGVIIDAVKKARRESPACLYCCDPVMGDVGRGFYVKPDIPDMFKSELVPLADIVCPNQFELEALTGIKVENIESALRAIEKVHNAGPSIVIVTSYKEKNGELSILGSSKNGFYKVTTPELPLGKGVAGTGDMTCAVFLSRYLETGNLEKSLELCTSSVFGILEASYNAAKNVKEDNFIELNFIQAQQELVEPSHSFKAEKIKQ